MVTGFALVMIGIGGISFLSSCRRERSAQRFRTWARTRGVVVESGIRRFAGSSRLTQEIPDVHYRYRVGGQVFFANSILPDRLPDWSFTDDQSRQMSRYSPGAGVDVRYNPSRPWETYLEMEIDSHWLDQFLGLGILVTGLLVLVGFYN